MSIPEAITQNYPEPAVPLTELRLGDDTVLVLDPELALVSSKTEPGVWHVVTAQRACTCKGYQYRSACRHLKIAEQATSPTAEDRVAARQSDPQERSFYDTLEAAADAPPADTELARRFGGLS